MDSKVHILISFIVFVFFVIGTFLFSYLDRRKIRKELEDPSGTLISPNERIIADRTKLLFIGIGLTLFGGYSVLFVRINTAYMIAVSIMLLAGIFILLLFLVKKSPSGYLQFSEEGLTIGLRNGSHTIPWAAFQSWEIAEVFGNISVLIVLKEPILDLIQIQSQDPNYILRVRKIFSQNFSLLEAHIMIMLGIWKISPEDIVFTLREYTNRGSQ
ncbi:hypothetical protein EHQ81_14305 [Leptospira selangorensis]|uniref:Uncharacterized protein n=1 Tax=Leptospira selangorensis TaxID=2484982 RepID=A0A5F2BXB9_9LEPT|nr:hypothetical protein [Leptospira selangorensis]TGM12238.1 hypothetical protein EHQ81_14305 [Leptospira selangorensis]TGM14719.1 hypothetical protein EHQ82_18305 [Leptospira selangorensis]